MLNALFVLSLATSTVSAGPHGRLAPALSSRRHHARRAPAHSDFTLVRSHSESKRDECDTGAWQCAGDELQHCNQGSWISVETCSGENIVCSADSRATGCIWSWSLEDGNPVTVSSLASRSATINGDDDSETTSMASESSVPSDIGNALYGGHGGGRKHRSSYTQDWYGASTTDDSAPSSTAAWWATSPTGDWSGASVTASSGGNDWYGQTSSASTSTKRNKKTSTKTSASATRTSLSASASPTGSGNHTGGGGSVTPGSFSAPHYVIYSDYWLGNMPSASDLSSYNRFILAFWMANQGAVDNAQFWEQLNDNTRAQTIEEYHSAGIALMVSAFGSTDFPTSDGVDPTSCAQELAAWVKKYGMDGVDIDYEDMDAMNNGHAEAWLITFQRELRSLLPGYVISHAPVAPWFTSGSSYSNGAYVKVHQEVGDGIDWYNIQFYNQGTDAYTTCDTLITDSDNSWPDTSVLGIHSNTGMPLDKIVIGKPLDSGAAANGYMDGSTLASCVSLARSQGWNAGVMFWEWKANIAGSLIATVLGN